MRGLHYTLKQRIKNGVVKLNDLRPNTRDIAKRLIAEGVFYVDVNGYIRSNEL